MRNIYLAGLVFAVAAALPGCNEQLRYLRGVECPDYFARDAQVIVHFGKYVGKSQDEIFGSFDFNKNGMLGKDELLILHLVAESCREMEKADKRGKPGAYSR